MDREPRRRVVGRCITQPLVRAAVALTVFALFWVPAVGRAVQPLVAGHAIASMTKVAKAAVVPHDPIASLPCVAAIRSLGPSIHAVRFAPGPHIAIPIDRAADCVGLRAPPVLV